MSGRGLGSARTRQLSSIRFTLSSPVILTQRDRSTAILTDVAVYEGLPDGVALLRAVRADELEMLSGDMTAHANLARVRAPGSPSASRLDIPGGVDAR